MNDNLEDGENTNLKNYRKWYSTVLLPQVWLNRCETPIEISTAKKTPNPAMSSCNDRFIQKFMMLKRSTVRP